MKISFVIPTYNHGQHIANAINSCLLQTYKDIEVIVADDGSIDKTEEMVKKFKDERVRYFRNSHRGSVWARNFGVEMATGEIIGWNDADDISLPDRIEKCFPYLNNDVIYHGIYENAWNENLGCMARIYRPALEFNEERLLREQYIPGICFFKKELWKKKPLRAKTGGMLDWMMHLDWAYSNARYYSLDIGLYDYIRTVNSLSQKNERSGARAGALDEIKLIMKNEYSQDFLCDADMAKS